MVTWPVVVYYVVVSIDGCYAAIQKISPKYMVLLFNLDLDESDPHP